MDRALAETLVAGLASDETDRDLLWAILPTLHECSSEVFHHPPWFELPRDFLLRTGFIGPRLIRVGDIAALINTENQARSLMPIIREVAHHRDRKPRLVRPSAMGPGDFRRAWRRCASIETEVLSRGRHLGVTLDQTALRRRLLKAIRGGFIFGHAHDRHDVRKLIVSNQHLADHRSALRAAHRRGATSLYVPHAPAADTDAYRDLPVTVAALRGQLEEDFYAQRGALPERLRSVGNPAFPEVSPAPRLDGPVVVGLSPWPRERLQAMIDLVADGVGRRTPVVVAPHPRSDRREISKLIPRAWAIHSGRTVELLRRGPSLLVQHSSGVAWEGLYLGVPTVQISLGCTAPTYALITAPYVPTVRSAAELRDIVMTPSDRVDRAELRDWARRWCVSVGDIAAKQAANALEDMPRGPTLALDAWSVH